MTEKEEKNQLGQNRLLHQDGSSARPTTTTEMANYTFRSILPHESLPTFDDSNNNDNCEDYKKGYIHLQGAFEPKQKLPILVDRTTTTTTTTTTRKVDGHPDSNDESDDKYNNNNNSCYFWTAETLQQALFSSLQKNVIGYDTNNSDNKEADEDGGRCGDDDTSQQQQSPPSAPSSSSYLRPFTLPYVVESVEIVDPTTPPYTKVRLTYGSPEKAQYVQAAWKAQKVSPQDLFFCTQFIQQQEHQQRPHVVNNTDANEDRITFGSYPCQVTLVTNVPFPPHKNVDEDDNKHNNNNDNNPSHWPRSNPPKFRRLLHDRTDAIERSQTRFIYVNGLQLSTTSSTMKDIIHNVGDTSCGVTQSIDNNYNSNNDIPTSESFWYDTIVIQKAIRNVFGQDIELFLSKHQHPKKGGSSRIQQQQEQNNNSQQEEDMDGTANSRMYIESCHIGFRSPQVAQRIVETYQGIIVKWEIECGRNKIFNINSGPLFLDYVTVTNKSHRKNTTARLAKGEGRKGGSAAAAASMQQNGVVERGMPSRPDCTSTTDHVHIPGLVLVHDYLTVDEENVLMAVLTGPYAPWAPEQINKSQTGIVKRKVQHYGYVFDYKTADVLRDRNDIEAGGNCPPLPGVVVVNNDEEGNSSSSSSTSNDNTVEDWIKDGRGWDVMAALIDRTRRHQFDKPLRSEKNDVTDDGTDNGDDADADKQRTPKCFPDLNQLTVNQYKQGEGIGSHIDTPSAFGDGLISISLNGGIVMEFQEKVNTTEEKEDVGDIDVDYITNKNDKKLVYLPPRSLLLMSGPARYEWEHQIVTRRTDTVDGIVMPRALRVSLTLRTALDLDGQPMPRVESNVFPPIWTTTTTTTTRKQHMQQLLQQNQSSPAQEQPTKSALVTPDTERDHVHAVYDAIATQWHHTRGKRGVLWPGATQFLQNLPLGSVVADVGCGDGKYFPAIWEAGSFVIGTDISLPLLETSFIKSLPSSTTTIVEKVADTRKVSPHRLSFQERPAVAVADCMSVPIRTDSCDAAICIAVMHHLSTVDRRIRCIEELVRIVKPGGLINIQAWAMEQTDDSKRKFVTPDVYVPFNAQPKYLDRVDRANGTSTSKSSSSGISPPGTINKDSSGETLSLPSESMTPSSSSDVGFASKSVAELYSEAYTNADFDERKGLVVFQRYCHMYRQGEMEEIASHVPNAKLVESGYESGNHFLILRVTEK